MSHWNEDEEQERLQAYAEIGDKGYEFTGEPEEAERLASWVDAMVLKYGEGSWIRVHVTVEEPDYKSWSFSISEEDYEAVKQKFEEKEEAYEDG